jgi:hypothetical protein
MPDPVPQQNSVPPPESTLQTIKRNLVPKVDDTSRAALGPGHDFDLGPSPQQQGEAEYKSTFGSPLERAHKQLTQFLQDHREHISEHARSNFELSISHMSDDLLEAADRGRTKTGGQLTMPARALVGAVGGAMQIVPVAGKAQDVFDTYVGKYLDFSKLAGHRKISDAPKPEVKAPVPQNKPSTSLPASAVAQATRGLG